MLGEARVEVDLKQDWVENRPILPHRARDAFHLSQKTRPAGISHGCLGNLSWKWGLHTWTAHSLYLYVSLNWSSKDSFCESSKRQNQSRKYEGQQGEALNNQSGVRLHRPFPTSLKPSPHCTLATLVQIQAPGPSKQIQVQPQMTQVLWSCDSAMEFWVFSTDFRISSANFRALGQIMRHTKSGSLQRNNGSNKGSHQLVAG